MDLTHLWIIFFNVYKTRVATSPSITINMFRKHDRFTLSQCACSTSSSQKLRLQKKKKKKLRIENPSWNVNNVIMSKFVLSTESRRAGRNAIRNARREHTHVKRHVPRWTVRARCRWRSARTPGSGCTVGTAVLCNSASCTFPWVGNDKKFRCKSLNRRKSVRSHGIRRSQVRSLSNILLSCVMFDTRDRHYGTLAAHAPHSSSTHSSVVLAIHANPFWQTHNRPTDVHHAQRWNLKGHTWLWSGVSETTSTLPVDRRYGVFCFRVNEMEKSTRERRGAPGLCGTSTITWRQHARLRRSTTV